MIPTPLSFLPRRSRDLPPASDAGYLDEVTEPGLYLVHQLGVLLRIPASVPVDQRSCLLELLGSGRWIVTRLSSNAEMPTREARRVASRVAYGVDF